MEDQGGPTVFRFPRKKIHKGGMFPRRPRIHRHVSQGLQGKIQNKKGRAEMFFDEWVDRVDWKKEKKTFSPGEGASGFAMRQVVGGVCVVSQPLWDQVEKKTTERCNLQNHFKPPRKRLGSVVHGRQQGGGFCSLPAIEVLVGEANMAKTRSGDRERPQVKVGGPRK